LAESSLEWKQLVAEDTPSLPDVSNEPSFKDHAAGAHPVLDSILQGA
jgi:hypothetical protein